MNYNVIREKKQYFDEDKDIQVFFHPIEDRLIECIEMSKYVVGCMAWVTSYKLLNALGKLDGVKIILNKEKFVNEKKADANKFYSNVRIKYARCKDYVHDHCSKGAFLTFGEVDSESRMHHKFLIFMDADQKPWGIWTGSYNLSRHSEHSIENAVLIRDKKIIQDYLEEFNFLLPYTDPVNWDNPSLNI
jgi:phosphatidylserine/phosphatidylglycerophosphate/cardiolipin synthase-like enzyme